MNWVFCQVPEQEKLGLTTEYRATFPTILIEVARWLGSRFQGIIQMARWLVSRFPRYIIQMAR